MSIRAERRVSQVLFRPNVLRSGYAFSVVVVYLRFFGEVKKMAESLFSEKQAYSTCRTSMIIPYGQTVFFHV